MDGSELSVKFYDKFRKLIRDLSAYRIGIYSANASFYIFLSIFPGIMLIIALLPYFGFEPEVLLQSVRGLIPEILSPLMERLVSDMEENSGGVLLSTTVVVAVWSSSAGVYCIRQGLNAIYGIRDNRSYFHSRMISMAYMVILIFALLLTLTLSSFGRELAGYFLKKPVPILNFIGRILQFRALLLFLLLTVLFLGMYCVFPNRKLSVGFALPGASLASGSWLIFTSGYSYYARHFGSYSVLYGSLSIIAMGMFWLYVCISILFYGAVLNLYWERGKK